MSVALQRLGTDGIAFARFATVQREAVVIGQAFVATQTGDAGSAEALSRPLVASLVVRSDGVAIATTTTLEIEIFLKFTTIFENYFKNFRYYFQKLTPELFCRRGTRGSD